MLKYLIFIVLQALSCASAWSQFTIQGQVKNAQEESYIEGVYITIKERNLSAVTDKEGYFTINKLPKGKYTLIASHISYKNNQRTIDLNENLQLQIQLEPKDLWVEPIEIISTRVKEQSAMAYSELSRSDLDLLNLGQDLPVLLNYSPAFLATSDAGNGIGYTGLRIRGSDAQRINVTINGIPLNDAESSSVFWVNMPDFASSVQSIQIQRGLGSSSNGAGAFGGTINIQTNPYHEDKYVHMDHTFGTFNTWKHSVSLGTGLLKEHFTFDARLSKISSDGFIDRAAADLKSFFVSGAYYGKNNSLKINVFSGKEKTYQAWDGVPEHELEEGNRSYNGFTYDNETDNYQQDHYQAIFNQKIHAGIDLNVALHLTRGKGYFEQYKEEENFEDYGWEPIEIEGEEINQTDLIRQRWLDNYFYGFTYALRIQKTRFDLTLGGAWNRYEGDHFGEVIWAATANAPIRDRYYDNEALKTDFNIYSKWYYHLSDHIKTFLDLQYRKIGYGLSGIDNDRRPLEAMNFEYDFFNPKLGMTYYINSAHQLYTSIGIGNKEPNRDDFVSAYPERVPESERMYDFELGYQFQKNNVDFQVNYYYMKYDNQLIVTGELNDVGGVVRTNVPSSYRTGLEIINSWDLHPKINWQANITISQNKIEQFSEILYNYDNGEVIHNDLNHTDIALSPSIIGGSQLQFRPFNQNFTVTWLSKYVGKQYLDNTSNENRMLDPYWVNDLKFNYIFHPEFMEEISFGLLINNILNEAYESNGYTYSYIYENNLQTYNFYYPQAGTHFLFQISVKL